MKSMQKLTNALELYERQEKVLSYGTAGFRENVDLPLTSVFIKMGILGALRSQTVGSKCIGIMVTASHNPECDNGVKIVDSDGGMMAQSWEPYAEQLVNTKNVSEVLALLENIAEKEGVDKGTPSVVVIGRDTRPHSEELAKCILNGAEAFGAIVHDLGLVTTPQLHFIVQRSNEENSEFPVEILSREIAMANYHATLRNGYLDLIDSAETSSSPALVSEQKECIEKSYSIVVDGSYGIGAISIIDFATSLNVVRPSVLNVDLRNGAYQGSVNEGCGAEYVQKKQLPPKNIDPEVDAGKILCSFDGDADRIVFHSYLEEDKRWVLLDGDKIAALFSIFISQELKASGLDEQFKFGVVQTAYANGASTIFLKEHGISVTMAKTGVKYLHHKAQEFDLGVYFEANGHGTVLFSDNFLNCIQLWKELKTSNDGKDDLSINRSDFLTDNRVNLAMRRLNACSLVINQAVGDAVSDMLMTLATLKILGMDIPSWHKIYTDLPSKQLKVPVLNKSLVTCSEDETSVITPKALQDELDVLMSEVSLGRCFIRPSGTEDVVRVYAEGRTQDDADRLASGCVTAISKRLG